MYAQTKLSNTKFLPPCYKSTGGCYKLENYRPDKKGTKAFLKSESITFDDHGVRHAIARR